MHMLLALVLAAGGTIGIRLMDAPVSRRDDPRALVAIVDHVAPGTSFERHLEVVNDTAKSVRFEMRAGAATIDDDQWVADPDGINELTGWVRFDPARFVVRPDSERVVTVGLDVPVDATLGERYAALFACTTARARGEVRGRSCVGVRTYLSVGLGAEPPSEFTVSGLRAEGDAVLADVHNTGQRALDVAGSLRLEDDGLRAGPFASAPVTIGIGSTGTVTIPVPHSLPRGPWEARLVLASGYVVHELAGTLLLDSGPVVLVEDDPSPWTYWPLAVSLALAVAAVWMALRWRRSRPRATLPGW